MKVKHLRWLFVCMGAVVVVAGFTEQGPVSYGLSYTSSREAYSYSGGTGPAALAFAVAIAMLYALLLTSEPCDPGAPFPGIFRRFIAFWIDLVGAMYLVIPIWGVVPMLIEWWRTGVFAWTFSRTTPAAGDGWVALSVAPSMFAAMLVYHAWPLTRGKSTPGACILGYRIVADEGGALKWSRALSRAALGFVAGCAAPLAPFVARRKDQGKFWLDKVFDTRAERIH